MSWYKTSEAALGVKEDAKSSDEIALRQAIMAEYDAINLYEQLAKSTDNQQIKDVLLSVAKEKKCHIGEFEKLLDEVDSEHKESVLDGKEETEENETEDETTIFGDLA